jgi:hypothetical protein
MFHYCRRNSRENKIQVQIKSIRIRIKRKIPVAATIRYFPKINSKRRKEMQKKTGRIANVIGRAGIK